MSFMRTIIVSASLVFAIACAPGSEETEPAGRESSAADVAEESDVREELNEAYEAVRDYSFDQREQLQRWSRERLEDVKSEIESLEERMRDVTGETREAWETTREALREKRESLEERIAQLRDSSSDAWDDTKSQTIEAMKELEGGVDEAMAEFRAEQTTDS